MNVRPNPVIDIASLTRYHFSTVAVVIANPLFDLVYCCCVTLFIASDVSKNKASRLNDQTARLCLNSIIRAD